MQVGVMGSGVSGLLLLAVMACGGSSTRKDAPGSGGASDDVVGTSGESEAGAVGGSGGDAGPGAGASDATGAGATGAGATGAGATGTGGTDSADGGYGGSCGRGGCILPVDDRDPIEPPGPVYCGGAECAASEVCCLSEQVCFDPEQDPELCAEPAPDDDTWGRKPCASNAHCGDKEFCSIDEGCSGVGHCQPISNCGECSSSEGHCRVCGCDGNTYSDRQTACLAQTSTVNVNSAGCGETVTEGGDGYGGAGGGGPGSHVVRVLTPCANDAQCPDGQLCCTLRNLCYAEDTPYLCEAPPAGTNAPCLTDADCRLYEYCWGAGCEAPGGCVGVGDMADDCGVTLEPVCGCDGTSYTSAACADQRGVRIASAGECDDEE